jgi:hypothetical protein
MVRCDNGAVQIRARASVRAYPRGECQSTRSAREGRRESLITRFCSDARAPRGPGQRRRSVRFRLRRVDAPNVEDQSQDQPERRYIAALARIRGNAHRPPHPRFSELRRFAGSPGCSGEEVRRNSSFFSIVAPRCDKRCKCEAQALPVVAQRFREGDLARRFSWLLALPAGIAFSANFMQRRTDT